jgi:hypothetical protein
MMRILTNFVTGAALLMTTGLIGCGEPDPVDTMNGDGDGDPTGETGDGDGDPGECNTYDPELCPVQPLTAMGVEGSFCGCPCVTSEDCPMGPEGTNGACALMAPMGMDPEFCALICTPDDGMGMPEPDVCPEGSSCKATNQEGVGLCTYP